MVNRERVHGLYLAIAGLVVTYALAATAILASIKELWSPFKPVAVFLTSVGMYRVLLWILFKLVNSSRPFLKIYWGNCFLDGYWAYTYTLQNRIRGGVWKIHQDSHGTSVLGFGIDENFVPRSDVRSVTQLLELHGGYEIVNERTDVESGVQPYYSKTTLLIECKKNLFFKSPYRMRGKTVIFGGPITGTVHPDVIFEKLESATCEQDVVAFLKSRKEQTGNFRGT